MKHIYTSVDIGSDSIKIIVCELYQNKLNLLAASSFKSKGIKKGLITDVDLASLTVKQAFTETEQMLGIKIKRVIASVPSYNAEYTLVTGENNIENSENIVMSSNVLDALENSIKTSIISDKELVTVLPIDFSIDNKEFIQNPVGKKGKKITSRAMLVTAHKKAVYSVVSLLENLGIEVVDISLNNIGDLYAFKNSTFDNKVGAIINIGAENTNVSLYNKSVIFKSSVVDMGGRNIDKDISYMYKIDDISSEKIKMKFALAHKKFANTNELYEIKNKEGNLVKINQFEVSEIVMARLEEILNLVKKELNLLTSKKIDYIIITGGTSNIAGFEYIANEVFGKNINIGNIKMLGIRNNKYSSCIGNIVYFINKLKLKNKNYSMLSLNDEEQLASVKKNNYNTSDSMLGKIFGYFFGESD